MTDHNITDNRPDFLSGLTITAIESNKDAYQALVIKDSTTQVTRKLLGSLKPADLVTVPIVNPDDASAMLAGLWLWHDALKECHEIAQDLIGPTGSFWHAIMHRREGDFSNAKYWYARCVDHRALRLISAMAMDVIGRKTTDESLLRIVGGEYNPDALVDLVAEIHGKPDDPRRSAVVRLQQMEWEALYYHCAFEATGSEGGMF